MSSQITLSKLLGQCLAGEDVEYVFTLPGHGNIAMLDGILDAGIALRTLHHETIAGLVADGYARASRKPGIVCLTCSPGAFNAMLSVVTAAMDCTPMIYIVGDTPQQFAGKSCYEEFDLAAPDDQYGVLRSMFKRSFKVTNAAQLPDIISQAFNSALTGKPGPVLIDVPLDLQTMPVDAKLPNTAKRRSNSAPAASAEALERTRLLLRSAKRPVIFAGGGARAARAGKELLTLAETMNAVVVASLAGSGVFPMSHRLFAGNIGSYGVKTANEVCNDADLILAVGTKFEESETSMWLPEYVFNPEHTRFIQIDIDEREIGKNYEVEIGIVGDAKVVLGQLADVVSPPSGETAVSRAANVERIAAGNRALKDEIEAACISDERPINPRRIIRALENTMPPNATITLDPSWGRVGTLQQHNFDNVDDVYLVAGILPVGWSSTACLGVGLAKPERKLVSVVGDGGFLLNSSIVASAVEYNLPIVWVVLNNRGYNSLGVLSSVYFGKSEGSWFVNSATKESYSPDYAMLAKAFGADGERVDDPNQLEAAFERAFKSGVPYVVDVDTSGPQSRLVRTAQVTWDYFWERATKKSAK